MRQDIVKELQEIILINNRGNGIAGYFIASSKNKLTKMKMFQQIVYAPSNQRPAITLQEVSNQFYIERAELLAERYDPSGASISTYAYRCFENWYRDRCRGIILRGTKTASITEEITMRNEEKSRIRTMWETIEFAITDDKDKTILLWKIGVIPTEKALLLLGVTTRQALGYRFRVVREKLKKELN